MKILSLTCSWLSLAFQAQAVLEYVTSPNGFDLPPRGWNSWALQADDKLLKLDEKSALKQCKAMATQLNTAQLTNKFTYCSLDSGWSAKSGDEYGRIVNDDAAFPDMTELANTLHGMGLLLGVYIKPGFFRSDLNKTIYGTDPPIELSSIINDGQKYNFEGRYQIDYGAKGAQEYCNSNIDLFASWGVDYIKLDHVTPGTKGAGLPHNNSGIAVCYHKAIGTNFKKTGHKIRLGLSPKLDLSSDYYKVWSTSADSLRLAGDVNHVSTSPNDTALVEWPKIQRTMAFLRAFLRSRGADEKLPIRPDLDILLMGNGGALNSLTDDQRLTTLAHWVASGANLFLGSDMTNLDAFGLKWLTNPQIWDVADFSAQHPIRPVGMYKDKAPSHGIIGEQFQSYVAGPNKKGEAIIMVTNYGDSGDNSYYIKSYSGTINFEITASMLKDFGLTSGCYSIVNVLAVTPMTWLLATSINVTLGDSETALYRLTPTGAQSANLLQDVAVSGPATAEPRIEVNPDKFYEPTKGRFYNADSAISFPRALALSLEVGVPPRIHSFAYNVGVATEHFLRPPDQRLADLVSFEKAWEYSMRYFETINTLFAIVDQEPYLQQLSQIWVPEPTHSLELETVACFVVLLGLFPSWPSGFEGQKNLVEYGQVLPDRCSFSDASSLLHYESLQAWSLRVIFVRCTTRPNITWMSSSIAMHLAESLGFHREYDTLEKLDLDVPALTDRQIDLRRRLFWIVWILNRMVSFEIGRSATFPSSINTLLPRESDRSSTDAFMKAYQCIYPGNSHIASENPESCLLSVLEMGDLAIRQDPLLALVRADMAYGLCRVIHKHNSQIHQPVGEHLVAVVRRGLEAARLLTEQSQPWWLLTSMPFQFICVAVAVGKSYVSDIVPDAMNTLEQVDRHFRTRMTQEACQTARLLLRIAAQNRDKEAATIYKALHLHGAHGYQTTSQLEDEDWGLY